MTDHDPTQTPPPDAALPGSVEAAFRRLRFACPCLQWGPEHGGQCAIPSATKVLRQAIAALTAQNASVEKAYVAQRNQWVQAVAEIERLRSENSAPCSGINNE